MKALVKGRISHNKKVYEVGEYIELEPPAFKRLERLGRVEEITAEMIAEVKARLESEVTRIERLTGLNVPKAEGSEKSEDKAASPAEKSEEKARDKNEKKDA